MLVLVLRDVRTQLFVVIKHRSELVLDAGDDEWTRRARQAVVVLVKLGQQVLAVRFELGLEMVKLGAETVSQGGRVHVLADVAAWRFVNGQR